MKKTTIAEATGLPVDVWDGGCLTIEDLEFDAATAARTVEAWIWLCGLDDAPQATQGRARREVLGDAGLFIAVNLPAREFFEWFRRADWEHFDAAQGDDSDAWAWTVMTRARAAVVGMGAMSLQCPIRAPRGGPLVPGKGGRRAD